MLEDAELNRLFKLYNLEDYLFGVVSPRFRESHTLNPYDFFAIVTWKSNRTKTKIMSGLANSGRSVPSLMYEVSAATSPEGKVEALLRVWGIGLALASAILTVCYPEEFTVLDYRAWEALREAAVEGLPARYPLKVEEYLLYCRASTRLAAEKGISLRDLDRALWAKSWEDDLLELITQGGLSEPC
jgi:thermostable 8-oxoguanine DNA glycosylase